MMFSQNKYDRLLIGTTTGFQPIVQAGGRKTPIQITKRKNGTSSQCEQSRLFWQYSLSSMSPASFKNGIALPE